MSEESGPSTPFDMSKILAEAINRLALGEKSQNNREPGFTVEGKKTIALKFVAIRQELPKTP